MIGYKAFNKDLTCKGFQYEIGQTYSMDERVLSHMREDFTFANQSQKHIYIMACRKTQEFARLRHSVK